MPTRIPLVNGMRSSPAARIVSSRSAGSLVGEPWWATRSARIDSSISPWEAVTSLSRARSVADRAPRLVCGSRPRSSARSQHHTTYATKSSNPSSASRARTPGWCPGSSPVSTSSSFTRLRTAPSSRRSTSSGSCRCARCVAKAQYLQCETHVRDSESVRFREKVTRRGATPAHATGRLSGSLARRDRSAATAWAARRRRRGRGLGALVARRPAGLARVGDRARGPDAAPERPSVTAPLYRSALEGEREVVRVALIAAERPEPVARGFEGGVVARAPVDARGRALTARHVADEVVVDLAGVVVAFDAMAAADFEVADLPHQLVEGGAGAE